MTVLEDKDYRNIARFMRDLMTRWKPETEDKIIKEISMPDVMDIIGKGNSSIKDVISKYWSQIKETEDEDISSYIAKIMEEHSKTVYMLAKNNINFNNNELQNIINKYIRSVPIIRI